MKLTTYFQIVVVCLLTNVVYSQELNAPDSLSVEEQVAWYFRKSNSASNFRGDYIKALECFNKGYELAKEYKMDSLLQVSMYYKGVVVADRGKEYYGEATSIFKNVIEQFKKSGDLMNVGRSYNQLGIMAVDEKKFEEAINYYDLSYKWTMKSDQPLTALTPTFNLTVVYIKTDQFDKAIKFAKKLDEQYSNYMKAQTSLNDYQIITEQKIKYKLAICYVNLDNYDLGIKMINNTLKVFKKHNSIAEIITTYTGLKKYESKKKNYEKALRYSDSLAKYKDQEFENWKKNNNEYVDNVKTMDNISLQLDVASKNIELKTEKNKKLTWSLILAAILILSLFAVSILLKQKNSTLEFLKIRAEDGARQKSKFIAMISHEIRTPLNALLGFSNLLLDENPAEHQKKHLNSIISSADYLLNLVNNVLNLNETENGILKADNHPIVLESHINNITDSFSLQTANKNNKLTVNYDPKIPRKLKSDSLKIAQILKNLLNNACKFTKDGNIWLNVTLFEDNNDHCMVNFEIKDTGVGIPKEKFESIFEAFSNDRLDIKKLQDGSGLGLNIVQKLLQALESEVLIESEVGRGSSFSFVLKMYKISEEVRPEREIAKFEFIGKKILIVEDNKINQILATKMLKSVEAIPVISENGLIGLETFKSKPIGYFDWLSSN